MGHLEPAPLPAELAAPPDAPVAAIDAMLDSALAWADDACLDVDYAVRATAEAEDAPRWEVTNDGAAEWAMRKVVEATDTLATLDAQRDDWQRRIEQWFVQAARRPAATVTFFTDHLERYALHVRDTTDGRTKTVLLPSGKVTTRDAQPKVVVTDEAEVVAWVEAHAAALGGAEVRDAITPWAPRKVHLTPLREYLSVVEVVDSAELLLDSGELVLWEGDRCPQPGEGYPDPEADTDLVADVRVVVYHWEVHGPDGTQVPGTDVDTGGTVATVKPEVPR